MTLRRLSAVLPDRCRRFRRSTLGRTGARSADRADATNPGRRRRSAAGAADGQGDGVDLGQAGVGQQGVAGRGGEVGQGAAQGGAPVEG